MARKKRKSKGNRLIYAILVLSIIVTAVIIKVLPDTVTRSTSYGISNPYTEFNPQPAKDSLQLYSFPKYDDIKAQETALPTISLNFDLGKQNPRQKSEVACGIASKYNISSIENGKCCVEDGPVEDPTLCCSGVPYCDYRGGTVKTVGGSGFGGTNCGASNQKSYPAWCNRKPVIYLYPKTKTLVSVRVKVPGKIAVSIPHYPTEGWKDIEANPDGNLKYKNKTYHELFYESDIKPISAPDSGIIVKRENLQESLKEITFKLGLNQIEQREFLAYWIPSLEELNTPFVQVSVFDRESKELIDHVDITPKPDTFIQFIMYFKGLKEKTEIKPLLLPEDITARKGFTVVEWGGIIDFN